jgi:hypothetical protein
MKAMYFFLMNAKIPKPNADYTSASMAAKMEMKSG